jgi:hypothetical protein
VPDAVLATAKAFLADPALPGVVFPGTGNSAQPPREWQGQKEVVCLPLGPGDLPRAGYVVTDAAGERLLDFMAPWPQPPVGASEVTRDQAEKTAREFAQRHLPELGAAGGEVQATLADDISPYGAYLCTLQRIVQGVRVPTRALVGVRIYDGKVVRWRPEQTAVTADLTVKLTKEQAQEIAGKNLPAPYAADFAPIMWLESFPEVLVTGQGQRCVWTVWAELKTKNTEYGWKLEQFCRWHLDAASGEVVDSAALQPTRELALWYMKQGGTRHSEIVDLAGPALFSDQPPVPSADGKSVLFASNRPRPGYPAWMERPAGIFLVDADGTNLVCLAPGPARLPSWSPDGLRFAYLQDGAIVITTLASDDTIRLSPEKEWPYTDYVWLPSGKIAAIATKAFIERRLVLLDPAAPQTAAVQLDTDTKGAETLSSLSVDAHGRLLFSMDARPWMTPPDDPKRGPNPFRLCRLDPVIADTKPQVIVPYMKRGSLLLRGPSGKLLAGASQSPEWTLVDTDSGATEPWRAPQVQNPTLEPGARLYLHLDEPVFSPDGQVLYVGADYWSGKIGDPYAGLLFVCTADGHDTRFLTKADRTSVPVYVFPATGKPAFTAPAP